MNEATTVVVELKAYTPKETKLNYLSIDLTPFDVPVSTLKTNVY